MIEPTRVFRPRPALTTTPLREIVMADCTLSQDKEFSAPKGSSQIKTCQRCGKSFRVPPSDVNRRVFCSMNCYRPPVTRSCENCGAEYRTNPAGKLHFCSVKCSRLASKGPRLSRKPLMDRFWGRVDKTPGHGPKGECWLYTGYLDDDGYGVFKDDNHKPRRAHKFSYVKFKGEVPEGINVCHECDIRNCVNPDHLWLGDNNENTQDMYRKGRGRNLRGSETAQAKLTESDVLAIRASEDLGTELAKRYGVSPATISMVRTRKIWAHV